MTVKHRQCLDVRIRHVDVECAIDYPGPDVRVSLYVFIDDPACVGQLSSSHLSDAVSR
jgi:hypothetical protein